MRIRKFFSFVGLLLKKRRWLVMLLFSLAIIIVEALEHFIYRESIFTTHFLTEVVVYGILIPTLGTFLLIWIDNVELVRDRLVSELNQFHEFSDQLRNCTNWDDLVRLITQFPQTILPIQSSALFTNNPERDNFELAASWNDNNDHDDGSERIIDLGQCQFCNLWSAPMFDLHKCTPVTDDRIRVGSERYCIPLAFKGYVPGILAFSLPEKQNITPQQLQTLRNYASEMALALENNHLQNMVQNQAEVSLAERKRIAQDLHDTLGQNISYLRLKLDQISEQPSVKSFGEIGNSLARMRDIADEAYLQIRETLADLHPSASIELEQSLRAHAESIGLRANFQVEFINKGNAVPLRSHVKRQVLYICREALNNVERHARARSVKIQLEWGQDDLAVTIADDGTGLNTLDLHGSNHLGMMIMSERAKDVDALLTLDSQVGQGTSVSLIVPLTAPLDTQRV